MNRSSESKLNKPSPVSPDIQTSQNVSFIGIQLQKGNNRMKLIIFDRPQNFIGHNREDPLSAPQWPNQMQFQPYKKPNGNSQ